jgi:hypothetical protein
MLHVMPNLMRNDIGCGEIPRRAKLAQQAAHEIQIYVNALIGGAVKGTNLRLRRAAARTCCAAVKHKHRFLIPSAECLKSLIPDLFGFGQYA